MTIWRCAGCGAGFPTFEAYEEHGNGCTPLRLGERFDGHAPRRPKQTTDAHQYYNEEGDD